MTDADDGRPTAEFLHRLGERVRARRTSVGSTVQELADRAGISRRMLTQIELGQANPSLVTVDKIARALGTDFAALTIPGDDAALSVTPPGAAVRVWESAQRSWAVLHQSTPSHPPAELWEWHLTAGDRYQARPDPRGSTELFLVLDGTLTIEIAGDDPAHLPAGTSARLASDRNYRYVNNTRHPVRFIRLVQLTEG